MSTVDKTLANLTKCKCVTCPSFTMQCKLKGIVGDVKNIAGGLDKAKHFEGMFCAFEHSDCIEEHKGCQCKTCAIQSEYKLDGNYYCTHK